jgi:CysZ protein
MEKVISAVKKAIFSTLDPRIMVRLLIPGTVSILLWIFLAYQFWSQWVHGLSDLIVPMSIVAWLAAAFSFFVIVDPLSVGFFISKLLIIFGLLPMMFLTAMAMTSWLLMPLLIGRIQKNHFPNLEKKKGGSVVGSIFNSLKATSLYLCFFILTIPLLIIPGMQILLPLILNSYLTKKVFSYDILQDFASTEERQRLLSEKKTDLQVLGVVTSFLFYLPMINFIAPAIAMLAFIFYLLEALEEMRNVKLTIVT